MARIPDDEIERLKREVSLEKLVTEFGIELRRHGAGLIGRCPFHDDREPSLVITVEKNPVALSGGVPDRWKRHRLGDAHQGREFSLRGRVAA